MHGDAEQAEVDMRTVERPVKKTTPEKGDSDDSGGECAFWAPRKYFPPQQSPGANTKSTVVDLTEKAANLRI